MTTVILTCVSCGKTDEVEDLPEHKRDAHCKDCGEAMIEKRLPGNTQATT